MGGGRNGKSADTPEPADARQEALRVGVVTAGAEDDVRGAVARLCADAARLLREGHAARAFGELARASRALPMTPRLAAALVRFSLRAGTEPAAITLLDSAVRTGAAPVRREVRRQLARVLRRVGQVPRAVSALEALLVDAPEDARARFVLEALRERLDGKQGPGVSEAARGDVGSEEGASESRSDTVEMPALGMMPPERADTVEMSQVEWEASAPAAPAREAALPEPVVAPTPAPPGREAALPESVVAPTPASPSSDVARSAPVEALGMASSVREVALPEPVESPTPAVPARDVTRSSPAAAPTPASPARDAVRSASVAAPAQGSPVREPDRSETVEVPLVELPISGRSAPSVEFPWDDDGPGKAAPSGAASSSRSSTVEVPAVAREAKPVPTGASPKRADTELIPVVQAPPPKRAEQDPFATVPASSPGASTSRRSDTVLVPALSWEPPGEDDVRTSEIVPGDSESPGATPEPVEAAPGVGAASASPPPAARQDAGKEASGEAPSDALSAEDAAELARSQRQEAQFIARRAWRDLAQLYLKRADRAKAPAARAEALTRLAEVMETELQDAAGAARMYREIVELTGDRAALREQVRLLSQREDASLVRRALDEAIQRARTDRARAGALLTRGERWLHMGELAKARSDFEAAEALAPGMLPVLAGLIRCVSDAERPALAERLRAACAAVPRRALDRLDALRALAHAAEDSLGDLRLAQWSWAEVLAESLDNEQARERLVALARRLGDVKALGQLLRAQLALEPRGPAARQARLELVSTLEASGDPDAALTELRQAVRFEPGHKEAWLLLAERCASRGQFGEAAWAFENGATATEDEEEREHAWERLALFCRDVLRNAERAQVYARRAENLRQAREERALPPPEPPRSAKGRREPSGPRTVLVTPPGSVSLTPAGSTDLSEETTSTNDIQAAPASAGAARGAGASAVGGTAAAPRGGAAREGAAASKGEPSAPPAASRAAPSSPAKPARGSAAPPSKPERSAAAPVGGGQGTASPASPAKPERSAAASSSGGKGASASASPAKPERGPSVPVGSAAPVSASPAKPERGPSAPVGSAVSPSASPAKPERGPSAPVGSAVSPSASPAKPERGPAASVGGAAPSARQPPGPERSASAPSASPSAPSAPLAKPERGASAGPSPRGERGASESRPSKPAASAEPAANPPRAPEQPRSAPRPPARAPQAPPSVDADAAARAAKSRSLIDDGEELGAAPVQATQVISWEAPPGRMDPVRRIHRAREGTVSGPAPSRPEPAPPPPGRPPPKPPVGATETREAPAVEEPVSPSEDTEPAVFKLVRERPLDPKPYRGLVEHFEGRGDTGRASLMREIADALEGREGPAPRLQRPQLTVDERAGLRHPGLRTPAGELLACVGLALCRLFPVQGRAAGSAEPLRATAGPGAPAILDALHATARILDVQLPELVLAEDDGPPFTAVYAAAPRIVVGRLGVRQAPPAAELRFHAGRALFSLSPDLLALRTLKEMQLLRALALLSSVLKDPKGSSSEATIVREALSPRALERAAALLDPGTRDFSTSRLVDAARDSVNRAGLVACGGLGPALAALRARKAQEPELTELLRFAASERYLALRAPAEAARSGR